MGMTPVKIDDRTEVRVKDNVAYQDSWGLMGLAVFAVAERQPGGFC